MEFRVLGSVEALVGGAHIELGSARQRCVLATLLVDANQVVPAEALVDRVWGEHVPHQARATLRTYLSRLRQALAGASGFAIGRRAGGYVLTVPEAAVDLHRFQSLAAAAAAAPSDAEAVALLDDALAQWRGEAFAGLDSPWVAAERGVLDAERAVAELDRTDRRLRLGQHAALVPELIARTAQRPLDERVAGQLMLALFRSGRPADALNHYHQLRARLAEQLGTDPGPELNALYCQLLGGGAAPHAPESGLVAPDDRAGPAPALLPTGVRGFAGRSVQLSRLDAVLTPAGGEPNAVIISAVSGTGGVGKTALAVHWARRVASQFPDGQLYVNLRGFDPREPAMPAEQALRTLLEALGLAPQSVPTARDAQMTMLRGLLSGKRMLILLDNARDADQVRPLLPEAPGCLVVVTSRDQLTGLVVAEGAHLVMLDVLSVAEAREMLAARVGRDRADAEPAAIDELIALCARLPLALAIVAARAAATPELPLATLARALRATGAHLDAFAGADPSVDVRAVISWSYQTLGEPARRLFRLLGLHHGPGLAAAAAASLAAMPVSEARDLLAELTGINLLVEPVPGRYTFHDLLRAYAIELVERDESADARQAARFRLFDHYLHTSAAAAVRLHPHRTQFPLDPPRPGAIVGEISNLDEALRWYTTEHAVLLASIKRCVAEAADAHAWRLVVSLTEYFDRRAHLEEQAANYRIALAAAERIGELTGQAHVHRCLGRTFAQLASFDTARAHFERALELYAELGDLSGQANVQHNLGWTAELDGRNDDSLHHDRLAHDLYLAAGDRVGQARTLNAIGWSQCLLGDYERAVECCEQALTLNQELGDRPGESATWDSIGYANHHLGRYRQALASYQRSLDLLRDLGDRDNEADVLSHVGDTHLAAGDTSAAAAAWRSALEILHELGHPDANRMHARLAELAEHTG
ncbi:MAG: AfsR/SARP family transcriptional regulator [Labedaea sp.]